ncbi:MAG: peptidase S11 [Betaproteobacteria bacterium]|nr:MAG: peptidase S11 [Betaproteobacteria bacterium]
MLRVLSIAVALLLACSAGRAEITFGSAHAIVVDETTGEVLLQKDGGTAAPIASLTKLMTAMVVLDAQQDTSEKLRIAAADMDRLKHTRGGVPLGAVVSRGTLLELALLASDNHAASALARHHPGGIDAFNAAVQQKIVALGLENTSIEEPTGLSPNNRSSAQDMVKVLRAATSYPEIARITSLRRHAVVVNGHRWAVRNTNGLVGSQGWTILLSKTGFTNEAGRCLSMRVQAAGRTVMVVLMGAVGSSDRALDALNIRRWLSGEAPVATRADKAHSRLMANRKRSAQTPIVETTSEIVVPPTPSFVDPGSETPPYDDIET